MAAMLEYLVLLLALLRASVRTRGDLLAENLLRAVLAELRRYDNRERPHRTLAMETPTPAVSAAGGPIGSRPGLGGPHRIYGAAA